MAAAELAALNAAAGVLRGRMAGLTPSAAILVDAELSDAVPLEGAAFLSASELAGYPRPATGDAEVAWGRTAGVAVAVIRGWPRRCEGHPFRSLAFPVRLLRLAGVRTLILCGRGETLEPGRLPGDLALVADHINWMGGNPLAGPNLDELGPRFPDMSQAYDRALQEHVMAVAESRGFSVRPGTYVGIQGPGGPTPAEAALFRSIGGDVVGTALVPETLVARHMGMRVLGLVCLTGVNPAAEARDAAATARCTAVLAELIRSVMDHLVRGRAGRDSGAAGPEGTDRTDRTERTERG